MKNNKFTNSDLSIDDPTINMKVIVVKINQMFKDDNKHFPKFFDICAIDDIKETYNLKYDKTIYRKLHLLHCINFRDMEPDVYKFCVEGVKQLIKTAKVESFYKHEHTEFHLSDIFPQNDG